MTDDDWNIYDNSGNFLSNAHSSSASYSQSNWQGEVEAAIPFQTSWFDWKALIGVRYHQMSWQAWNTVQVNTVAKDGSQYSVSYGGMTDTLRQSWLIPYLGCAIEVALGPMSLEGSLRYSPYLSNIQTDEHVLRNLTFTEYFYGGFMLEPRLTLGIRLSDRIVLATDLSYRLIGSLRGDEIVSGAGQNASSTTYPNGSGSILQLWVAGLGIRISQ